jgi:hypothetical protein
MVRSCASTTLIDDFVSDDRKAGEWGQKNDEAILLPHSPAY